ncbi:putative RDD family membrane protein YckC [Granulicella aggregans]|uniref:Putative RDD family membrane protein YckC n=1 Tax=Granulicella aggregans TaxID=474949 RepID=A0A7W8E327_9BACT|nr:RDD family protein [Granulicella aggregans]MBB5057137.1 putative RDD family membrane protein YckC [Granulicella aggregans]
MNQYGSFTDQLNIETPEQVELRFPVAGIGSRFLAVLTDSIIQFVAVIVTILLFVVVGAAAVHGAGVVGNALTKPRSETAQKWFVAVIILFYFLLYWGYFSLFEALWNGQTPGKRLLKIRVIKDSGRQITFFEALARNLLRVVDSQPAYLIGVITMLCNKQQKRLGDFVAGTIVVHERLDEQPMLAHNSRTFTAALYTPSQFGEISQPQRPGQVPLAADAVARLQKQDLNVIDAFLARALDLEMTTREEMAAKIAARIAARMQITLSEGVTPERFLEAVAFDMRAGSRR